MQKFFAITCLVLGFVSCTDSDFTSSIQGKGGNSSGDANLADDTTTSSDVDADGNGTSTSTSDSTDCTSGKSHFAPLIDFENITENKNPKDDFVSSHNIKLIAKGPGRLVVRKTTRKNEAQPARDDAAWFCIRCEGQPSYNRLMDKDSEDRIKRKVLSTTDAMDKRTNGLRVEYTKPVSRLAFDLIDVDGNEEWTIKLFGSSGHVLQREVFDAARGYKETRTENGRFKTFRYARPQNDIYAVEFEGKKGTEKFGFAFDNFDTGSEICDP